VATAKPGNGAQRAGLVAASTPLATGCAAADASDARQQTPNGFVVLNAPGKPAKSGKNAREDGTRKLLGQITLRGATAGTTYTVLLNCTERLGELTTDGRGDGSFRFADSSRGAGTYFVALRSTPLAGLPLAEQLLLQDRFVTPAVQVR
jgi:hypothetical protein